MPFAGAQDRGESPGSLQEAFCFLKLDLRLHASTNGKLYCFSNLETLAVFEPSPTARGPTHSPPQRTGDCFTIQKSGQRRS